MSTKRDSSENTEGVQSDESSKSLSTDDSDNMTTCTDPLCSPDNFYHFCKSFAQ